MQDGSDSVSDMASDEEDAPASHPASCEEAPSDDGKAALVKVKTCLVSTLQCLTAAIQLLTSPLPSDHDDLTIHELE